MAPRTDCTTRIPSSVASPVTMNHTAKGSVFVNLRNTSNLKIEVLVGYGVWECLDRSLSLDRTAERSPLLAHPPRCLLRASSFRVTHTHTHTHTRTHTRGSVFYERGTPVRSTGVPCCTIYDFDRSLARERTAERAPLLAHPPRCLLHRSRACG